MDLVSLLARKSKLINAQCGSINAHGCMACMENAHTCMHDLLICLFLCGQMMNLMNEIYEQSISLKQDHLAMSQYINLSTLIHKSGRLIFSIYLQFCVVVRM